MLDANEDSMLNLKAIMSWFKTIFSLHVNFVKRSLYLVNEVPNREDLLRLWGCKLGTFLHVYHGMPLRKKFKDQDVWQQFLNRVRKRLALWKRKYLITGGNLVLIKSTLESMLAYLYSILVALACVLKELEEISQNFLWGFHKKRKGLVL